MKFFPHYEGEWSSYVNVTDYLVKVLKQLTLLRISQTCMFAMFEIIFKIAFILYCLSIFIVNCEANYCIFLHILRGAFNT